MMDSDPYYQRRYPTARQPQYQQQQQQQQLKLIDSYEQTVKPRDLAATNEVQVEVAAAFFFNNNINNNNSNNKAPSQASSFRASSNGTIEVDLAAFYHHLNYPTNAVPNDKNTIFLTNY